MLMWMEAISAPCCSLSSSAICRRSLRRGTCISPNRLSIQIAHKGQSRYVYTDAEKDEYLKELGPAAEKATLQRYKGLGEMNPTQLWDTTMNPETRTLLQVSIDDATAADRTFDMLMGSAVPPRTRFITTHAHAVRNLDI